MRNQSMGVRSAGSADKQAEDRAFVLITPARNEAAFIEQTIKSVVAQTRRPARWVIVSDGSTDGTDDIVKRYAAEHDWIELVRMPERKERDFAGKVRAFNAGYARVKHMDYDVIGNLDGDVSFEPDYLEYLLGKFAENPKLGLAGTNYWEGKLQYDYRFTSIEDVAGACQLFRRECFEAIGGYQPVKCGGIDLIAVLSARMHGWETRTFTGKYLIHHRQQGTATANWWMVHFNDGTHDYLFGGHPVWEVFRAAYRMRKKPYVIGACLLFGGYFWSMVRRVDRPVSKDLVQFRRKEQMNRLTAFFRKLPALGGARQDGEPASIQSHADRQCR